MKLIFALLTLCFICSASHAQKTVESSRNEPISGMPVENKTTADEDNKIYSKVDIQPSFPGGDTAWASFLIKNLRLDNVRDSIKFPAGKNEFSQTVIVKFIVGKDGEVSNVIAENKDAEPNCIAEAVRVVKRSRKWIPAQLNGKPVNAYRRQPISFFFQKQN